MPTHLSFEFGIGNFFNFKFEYRPREPSPAGSDPRDAIYDFDYRCREPSPARFDPRDAILDSDIARVGRSFQRD